jgi:hypothetical protein
MSPQLSGRQMCQALMCVAVSYLAELTETSLYREVSKVITFVVALECELSVFMRRLLENLYNIQADENNDAIFHGAKVENHSIIAFCS